MERRRALVSPLLATLLYFAVPAAAESMRCEGGLVTEGDLQLEVLEKCGEPQRKEGGDAAVVDDEGGGIERWTYNFGPNRFYYVVRFFEGRVVEIQSPGYGD